MFSESSRSLQPLLVQGAQNALCIIGATHGDEPAGVHALQKISEHIQNKDWVIEGLDIFGLIGNPDAYAKNVRFIDHNLNRMFQAQLLDDETNTSSEVMRAREIESYFLDLRNKYKTVYVLDVHSVSMSDIQMGVYIKDDVVSKEIIERISPIALNFAFNEECVPGSTSGCAMRLGCVGFAIEAGSHSSPNASLVALDIIERFIEDIGSFTTKNISYRSVPQYVVGEKRTYTTIERIIPQNNFKFSVTPSSELFLAQGIAFGENNDGAVVAKQDCYMMMPSKIPNEKDFDAGFLCLKS